MESTKESNNIENNKSEINNNDIEDSKMKNNNGKEPLKKKSKRKEYDGFHFFERLKAMSVHLLFSIIIFIIILFIIFFSWYPGPHFKISGGLQGMKILTVVDLVIGPLLTFFLFNLRKPKKEIIIDLSIIFIIQIGLLIYGVEKIYSQKPVVQALTYEGYIGTAIKEDFADQQDFFSYKGLKELNSNKEKPIFVYVKPAETEEEQAGLTAYQFMQGLSPEAMFFLYEDISKGNALADVKALAPDAKEKLMLVETLKEAINKFEEKNKDKEFYFYPLKGKYGESIVVLDENAKIVDYLATELYK